MTNIINLVLSFSRPLKRAIVVFIDCFLSILTVLLSFALVGDHLELNNEGLWIACALSIVFAFPIFIYFGLYKTIFRYIGSAALASIVSAFSVYTTLFFFVFTLIGINTTPRSIGVIQPLLFFIAIGSSRYFIRVWLASRVDAILKGDSRPRPITLIFGSGTAARQLAAGLSLSKEMVVKGFIDDEIGMHGNTINGIAVYPSIDLADLIKQLGITDVLLAIPSVEQSRRNEIIATLSTCSVRVRTLPGIFDMDSGLVRSANLHELDVNDLLGRQIVPPIPLLLRKNIEGKTILVTGAGGSIGGEICRQVLRLSPRALILVDNSEHSLYSIYQELSALVLELHNDEVNGVMHNPDALTISMTPYLASVRDEELMRKIFSTHYPDTVFHAAAYKHVPLVEQNPAEGIKNNVLGTLICANISRETQVSNFVLVSTDKAVRPTNIMGASKRIAELVLQALAQKVEIDGLKIKFSMVRFGNVLGSSGSVAPLFNAQIRAGGPITLTDPEVTRFFMTIPEAAQLVIQSSAMANGGDVFVLDMGKPVRIYDLAAKMVYLSGLLVKDDLNPHGDIEIKVIGLRPGEKLYEELLIGSDPKSTQHPKILKANEEFLSWEELELALKSLIEAVHSSNIGMIRRVVKGLVPGYQNNEA